MEGEGKISTAVAAQKGGEAQKYAALCAQAEGYSSMQSAMDVAAWTRQLTVTNSLKIACNYCDI